MIRSLAALALLVSVGALADEPAVVGYSPAAPVLGASGQERKAYPAIIVGTPSGKVIYRNASSELSVAMCGIEGHGKNTDLDAGLIDFNLPDPARSAGPRTDDSRELGRGPYDYHSSIVLGVTLGYRF